MRFAVNSLAVAALVAGGVSAGWGQTPTPSPSPSPSPSPASSPSPAPSPSPAAPLAPGLRKPGQKPQQEVIREVRLRAERQEMVEKGHYRASGFADMQFGGTLIQADVLDVYETERPDGTKGRRIVATGNVVYAREEERIAGDRLDMDLDSGQGTFSRAMGYVQPGLFVEADTIERIDQDTYRIKGGTFTSCSQPNPRWGFTATSAKVHLDDKVVGKNVVFRVKSAPVLYFPYFMYPIKEDERATGLLAPRFGYSTIKGYDFGEGFFWAMGRSFDQTFYVDHYSVSGWGFGHEFRYALDAPSKAVLRSYVFKTPGLAALDYDLDWTAIQSLPGQVHATVGVREVSRTAFQQTFQDSLNQASSRSRRSIVSLRRSLGANTLSVTADSSETLFGSDTDEQRRINRHLPSVRLDRIQRKIGHSQLVFGFASEATTLEVGNQDRVDRYTRFDAGPQLSISTGTTYLQVTPSAEFHYTHYGKSNVLTDISKAQEITGDPLNRRYFEGRLELRGPTFARVFNNSGTWYSDKFKHTIGPEVTFTYRTAVEDFVKIPKFDGLDQVLGTNEVRYGIVQRFFAKRPTSSGKTTPYEFLSWSLTQTYYVKIKDSQNAFDPNYSTNVFGPGITPDHNSPILSMLRFTPLPRFATTFQTEYDVNYKQVRTIGLSTNLNSSVFGLQGSYSRRLALAVDPTKRVPQFETVRGNGRLTLLGLSLGGSVDYDFVQKKLFRSEAKARYDVQCCGFVVDVLRYKFNGRDEKLVRFSIELANIGSIGNFFQDAPGASAVPIR